MGTPLASSGMGERASRGVASRGVAEPRSGVLGAVQALAGGEREGARESKGGREEESERASEREEGGREGGSRRRERKRETVRERE